MLKLLRVAQREYIETAKTKTFIVMILMLPVMIGVIVFFIRRLESSRKGADRPPVKIALTDLSGKLSAEIRDSFNEHNTKHPNRQITMHELQTNEGSSAVQEQGKAKLRRDELDAYVVLDKNILEGTGKIHLYVHEPKPIELDALAPVNDLFTTVVVNERYKLRNLSSGLLEELRRVPIVQIDVGSADDEERIQRKSDKIATFLIPFFFMYLLFLGIMTMGQMMLSSIIEEKSSRVIEVLLSAISPFQLMAGKILGLVAIGLTVVCLWGVVAYLTARSQGLNVGIALAILPCFIAYYVLAFLLFSSTMVGIGSICNTIKETQSLLTPVMLVCVLPLLAWQNILQDPNGTLARVLSFFPPTTPMVMILRLSAGSDIWAVEILASIVLLAAAVLAAMWVATKVFRTGILMYGKRPSLLEVARWLRQT